MCDAAKPLGKFGAPAPTSLQLRVTLLGIRPPIRRRVLVPSDGSGGYLHHLIQVVMGRQDGHLPHFILGKRSDLVLVDPPDALNDPMFPGQEGPDTLGSTWITIDELLRKGGGRVLYEYDFGDGWLHDVKLEKDFPRDPRMTLLRCVDGKRACPTEDRGGIYGYAEIAQMVKGPQVRSGR